MKTSESEIIWGKILEALEDKLQYGLLEQARHVVLARVEGEELHLTVNTEEAAEFFRAHVNQQRLILLSRGIINIEKITAEVAQAQPLNQ